MNRNKARQREEDDYLDTPQSSRNNQSPLVEHQIIELKKEVSQLRDFIMAGRNSRQYPQIVPIQQHQQQMLMKDEPFSDCCCCGRIKRILIFIFNAIVISIFLYMCYRLFF